MQLKMPANFTCMQVEHSIYKYALLGMHKDINKICKKNTM